MEPIALNVGNKVNQMGNFKELYVGAGSTILFKSNREGCFSGAANYATAPLKWNNAGTFYATTGTIAGNFTVSGSLFSDDGSAYQTKLLLGKISFLKSNVEKSFLKTPSGSSGLQLATGTSIYFTDLVGTPNAELDSASNLKFSNDAYISWKSGRKITADASSLTLDGNCLVLGGCRSTGFVYRSGSTDYDGSTDNDIYVADSSGGSPTKRLRFRGGILTVS